MPATPWVLSTTRTANFRQAEENSGQLSSSTRARAIHSFIWGKFWRHKDASAAAITYLKQSIAIDPQQFAPQLALSVAYSENGNLEEAIGALTQMRQRFPKAPEVSFNLGTAYAQQKRFKEAAAAYKEALQLDPQNSVARLSLVKALVSDFQYEAALPEIRDYARQHPGDFEARYMCGLALRGVGNYTEAESELRQADKLGPDHPDVTYNLGFVYARLGKLEEARQYPEESQTPEPGIGRRPLPTCFGASQTQRIGASAAGI